MFEQLVEAKIQAAMRNGKIEHRKISSAQYVQSAECH